MLRHRLASIDYQLSLLASESLVYAFRSGSGDEAILMYEASSLTDVDRSIKRDPLFPYSLCDVVPVISTVDMADELMDHLDERVLSDAELDDLKFPPKPISDNAEYWLAWKHLAPFSPLLADEVQDDIHRRTLVSQRAHHSPIELADDNPVGMAVGILIAEGTLNAIREHVSRCDVYPDTVVDYLKLVPLRCARNDAISELSTLGRPYQSNEGELQ